MLFRAKAGSVSLQGPTGSVYIFVQKDPTLVVQAKDVDYFSKHLKVVVHEPGKLMAMPTPEPLAPAKAAPVETPKLKPPVPKTAPVEPAKSPPSPKPAASVKPAPEPVPEEPPEPAESTEEEEAPKKRKRP